MVNAVEWLEQNYPTNGTCTRVEDTDNCSPGNAKNRSEIYNLDVSNQDLEGSLDVVINLDVVSNGFPKLKKLDFSFNKIDGW